MTAAKLALAAAISDTLDGPADPGGAVLILQAFDGSTIAYAMSRPHAMKVAKRARSSQNVERALVVLE